MKLFIILALHAFRFGVADDPCPPGNRRDGGTDECIPCESGRYNNGGMTWDQVHCFEPDAEGIEYQDATSVRCDGFHFGVPVYESGEYVEGCEECDEDVGCPTPSPTAVPSAAPTTIAPTVPPTPAPSISEGPCDAGQRRDPESGACIPCEPGRYNHGNAPSDTEDCFEIVDDEGWVYNDATSVRCERERDYYGTPEYEAGEYTGGCTECDENVGCPTPSPTTRPSKAPTGQPSHLRTREPTGTPTSKTASPSVSLPSQADNEKGSTEKQQQDNSEEDDVLSAKTRYGIIIGGVVLIVGLTFFAHATAAAADKKKKNDKRFERQHSSGLAEVGSLPVSPRKSRRNNGSARSAPSQPMTPAPAASAGEPGGNDELTAI